MKKPPLQALNQRRVLLFSLFGYVTESSTFSLMCIRQNDSNPRLEGWGGIENYCFKHDNGRMKNHADDIDTLLVFVSVAVPYILSSW